VATLKWESKHAHLRNSGVGKEGDHQDGSVEQREEKRLKRGPGKKVVQGYNASRGNCKGEEKMANIKKQSA